jgi:hypothetical protein
MDEQMPQQDPISGLLAEFGTRLNEVEEKQRLVRDRALLIGENLIGTKEDFSKETFEIKKQTSDIKLEIKELKQLMNRVINEIPNLARKSEVEILEHQAKIFDPIEFARIKDIEKIVERHIKKINKKETK